MNLKKYYLVLNKNMTIGMEKINNATDIQEYPLMVAVSKQVNLYKKDYDQELKTIVPKMSWSEFQKRGYSHEYLRPRPTTNQHSIVKLFFDIDWKIPNCPEEDYKQKLNAITSSLYNGSIDNNFVFTNGSFYDETESKLSFHIIYQDKYIDLKNIDIKKDDIISLFKKSLKGLNEELIEGMLSTIDDEIYKKNLFLRLPYGTQKDKVCVHIPQKDTFLESYFITYVKDGETQKCMGIKKVPIKDEEKNQEKENVPVKEETPEEKTKRAEDMLEMLKMVKKERFKEYPKWFELCCLMKQNGLNKKDFILFSKESGYEPFDEDKCLEEWFKLKDRKEFLGFPHIHKWLEEDGVNWKEVFCKKKNNLINDLLKAYNTVGSLTENNISPIFYKYYNDSLYNTPVG